MKPFVVLAAAAAAMTTGSASATTFDFAYSTIGGTTVTGRVEATNLGGFFSVDNVTGFRNGAAIDGYDFFDDTPQMFNYANGRASNVDFSYYVGANNYEIRFPGTSFGTEFTNGNSSDLVTAFSLSPASVAPSAVPETATWAMMILGVGGIGLAMRRRRGNAATTVAYA